MHENMLMLKHADRDGQNTDREKQYRVIILVLPIVKVRDCYQPLTEVRKLWDLIDLNIRRS